MAIARKPKLGEAVDQVKALIVRRWPEARFKVSRAIEARGTAIWTYCEGDFDDVTDHTGDLQFELMDSHNIFIYVIPMPLEAWEG